MNLTGNWKGKYTYGNGYPENIIGTREPFELHIQDEQGHITGTCHDFIVAAIPGNACTIEGTYRHGLLSFVKKYKYSMGMQEDGTTGPAPDHVSHAVDYVAHLHKKFLTGKPYFKGEWQITTEATDPSGNRVLFTVEGSWNMHRV